MNEQWLRLSMRKHRAWLALAVYAVPLAGCGGGGSSSDQPPIVTSLSGVVYNNAQSGTPISLATIETQPPTQVVTTGSDGRFSIAAGIQPDTLYAITASKAGFASDTQQVGALSGRDVFVTFNLDPLAGQMYVDPTEITFQISGDKTESQSFRIENHGSGQLDYQLTAAAPTWMTLTSSGSDTKGGSLAPSSTDIITVSADSGKMAGATGSDDAQIFVSSVAGNAIVMVHLEKLSPDCFDLDFYPGTNVDFGKSATVQILRVRNTGGGPMVWTASESLAWLNAQPATGAIDAGASQEIQLVADRAQIASQGVSTGEISFTASAGSGSVTCPDDTRPVTVTITKTAGVCSAGTIRCDETDATGKKYSICQPDESGEINQVCPGSAYCGPDPDDSTKFACVQQVCTPGSYQCKSGSSVQTCLPDGSGWGYDIACGTTEACQYSNALGHDACVCQPQCAGKECGDDGCLGQCGPDCVIGVTACANGHCLPVSQFDVTCDPAYPHSADGKNVCVSCEADSTSSPMLDNVGCMAHSTGFCLKGDSLSGTTPASPETTGIGSMNYRMTYTLISQ